MFGADDGMRTSSKLSTKMHGLRLDQLEIINANEWTGMGRLPNTGMLYFFRLAADVTRNVNPQHEENGHVRTKDDDTLWYVTSRQREVERVPGQT